MKALKSRINRWMKSFFQIGSFHLLCLALATGCGPSGSSEQSGPDTAPVEKESELAPEVSKKEGAAVQQVEEAAEELDASTQSSQQQQQSSATQSSGGQSSLPGMSKPAITQEEYRTLFEGIKTDLEAGEIDAAIAKAGIIAERNLSPAQMDTLKQIALPVRSAQNALRKAETGSQKMTPQALQTLKEELGAEALEKLKGVEL